MAPYVAELAMTFLLYAARNIDVYRAAMRRRSNQIYTLRHLHGSAGESLFERSVGLIGFGRIGRALADLLAPFRVRFDVHDPYVSRAVARRYPVRLRALDAVLRASDLLVVTAASTEETRRMLNANRLALLPDGAAIINVARGALVDLEALTREVLNGRLRCMLDVTDPDEPLPPRHPLRTASGAIVTPHIGAAAMMVRTQMADIILSDLERFFTGQPVQNRVTAAMLPRMT
jgi:phosphoglycerate dehydrogenase-like enzyme